MYLRIKNKLKQADKKLIEEGLDKAGYTDITVDVKIGSLHVPDIYKTEVVFIIEELAEIGGYIATDGENEVSSASMFDDDDDM